MIKIRQLLFIALLLSLLFSCQKDETIYINLYHNESDATLTLLEEKTAQFLEGYENVEFNLLKVSSLELKRGLDEMEPGIIRAPSAMITSKSFEDQLLELSGLFQEQELTDFHPEALKTMRVENMLFGLPDNFGSAVALFYDKTLIDYKQIGPRELRTIKWKIKKEQLPRYMMVFDQYDPYLLYPLISSTGKRLSNREDFLNFFDKKGIFTFQLLYDLVVNEMLVPINCDSNMAEELFFNGEALLLLSYNSNYDRYKLKMRDNLGIMRPPSFYSKKIVPTSWSRTEGYAVMNRVEASNLGIIKDYIAHMTSVEVQSEWKVLEKAPSISALLEDNSSDFTIANLLKSQAAPPNSIYDFYFKIVIDELQKMYHNQISPESAIRNSHNRLREALGEEVD